MTFDRRSYLKGTVLAGGALLGLQGVVTDGARSQSDSQPGAPGLRGRACPPGTRELARYSVDDGELALESGDDVITVSDVAEQGPVRSFSWESTEAVALVTAQFGPNRQQFEGGFEGEVAVQGPPISSVSFCAPRGGRAVLCELDLGMSHTYDTEFHLDGDPSFDYPGDYEGTDDLDEYENSEGPREGVVHVVTTGHTRDYAHAMINVASRTGERVALSNLERLTFGYYEGADNAGAIPDEVFLTFLTPEDQLYIAYVHLNRDVHEQSWKHLDVLDLIKNGAWSVEDVAFMDIVTSEGAVETARELRSAPKERLLKDEDDEDDYGDATLVGVGFGAGNTRNTTKIDRYFDELHAEWASDDTDDEGTMGEMFEFPALLPLSVENVSQPGQGRGPLEVSLSFTQAEMGVRLGEVAEETVTLNAFSRFAPPPEPGAQAEAVTVEAEEDEEELVVRFRPQDVNAVLDGEKFIVSGDFESQPGYSFFAVGELE